MARNSSRVMRFESFTRARKCDRVSRSSLDVTCHGGIEGVAKARKTMPNVKLKKNVTLITSRVERSGRKYRMVVLCGDGRPQSLSGNRLYVPPLEHFSRRPPLAYFSRRPLLVYFC